MKKDPKQLKNTNKELLTRKEAILKAGKYAAFTALATFTILNPKKAQAQSPGDEPGGGFTF
ncbi:MAG: hypothetical protein GQ540_08020 [Lutibacter sp.]|uniref:hypothetical protein n=1 Tax=Lutibacter sp. TaxID=1925666 RepID=UPI0019DFBB2C|nr:hypothetical protein [Lutibacter sp.]NOR28458.1 hypothetical protein [Lutibacter sp.]